MLEVCKYHKQHFKSSEPVHGQKMPANWISCCSMIGCARNGWQGSAHGKGVSEDWAVFFIWTLRPQMTSKWGNL